MEEQEVCQIEDVDGFYEWVEKEAIQLAFFKLCETFDDEEWEEEDLMLTTKLRNHELSRFLFSLDNLNYGIFILKTDIMNLIKGLANELVYSVLSKLTDKGNLIMSWDSEMEEFIWLKNTQL